MYNTEIEKKLLTLLENPTLTKEQIDEFGETCKKVATSLMEDRTGEPWRLRMSNIGRDIRQLHLEKDHGRSTLSIQTKLKFVYGALIEALTVLLLKASGVSIEEANGKCSLTVSNTEINGEFDLIIDDKVYDVKSASPYSYENKFKDINSLLAADEFGYVAQLVGYCEATGKKPGGWIVVNKVTGEIKVLEANMDPVFWEAGSGKIKRTVNHFEKGLEIPPCAGVVDEVWYKKPTGNKILNRSCEYCDCKFKCHPKLKALPDVNSKAANPRVKYYVELNNVPSPK